MNKEKAREFFSAYYEDDLEKGLRQSLDQHLRTDASLEADYSAFVDTLRALDSLRDEEIEVPLFLSDRIATRLEQAQPKGRLTWPVFTARIRGLAFAGLAVVALLCALPFVRSDHGTSQASIGSLGGLSGLDQMSFKADGSDVILEYQPSSPRTVIVSSPLSGKEIQRFNLDGQRMESPFQNSNVAPAVFKVEVQGLGSSSFLALPGTGTLKPKSGSGSIQDLAIAIAGHYHVPVVVQAAKLTTAVTWNFGSTDAVAAATQALANEGFSVDQRSGGLITILDR